MCLLKRARLTLSFFAQTIIQIASVAKAVSLEHSFSSQVKEGLSQLIKGTNSLLTMVRFLDCAFLAAAPSKTAAVRRGTREGASN